MAHRNALARRQSSFRLPSQPSRSLLQGLMDRQTSHSCRRRSLEARVSSMISSHFFGRSTCLRPCDSASFWTESLPFSLCWLSASRLCVADEEGFIRILEYDPSSPHLVSDLRCSARFSAHENAVFDVQYCPSSRAIASCSGDQKVKIIDIEKQSVVRTLLGHTGSVKSACFRQDSPFVIATGGRDGRVCIWDLRDSASPFGRGGQLCLSPFKSLSPSLFSSNDITSLSYMPDGSILYAGSSTDGGVHLLDMRRSEVLFTIRPASAPSRTQRSYGITSVRVNSSGTKVAICRTDATAYVYSALHPEMNPLQVFRPESRGISSFYTNRIDFLPGNESRFLLQGTSSRKVMIHDMKGTLKPAIWDAHSAEVSAVVANPFSNPADMVFATCSDDEFVRVWDGFRLYNIDQQSKFSRNSPESLPSTQNFAADLIEQWGGSVEQPSSSVRTSTDTDETLVEEIDVLMATPRHSEANPVSGREHSTAAWEPLPTGNNFETRFTDDAVHVANSGLKRDTVDHAGEESSDTELPPKRKRQ